ncbi:hypothetical protein RB195_008925 [Necator americanus]|uniref:Protein kinase domain-containing protein n=1 Tax=Necator americanus TaxID=51031 RepID=A0ABR1CQZ4_NECAM
MSDTGPVQLPKGKVVGKKWKILRKLGEGGCGAVYKVQDVNNKDKFAALKAESNFVAGGTVLKLEVQILRRLAGRPHVPELIHSGKKELYCYMVMTLLGDSLNALQNNRKGTPDSEGKLGTVAPGSTGLQESYSLPKRKRTRMTIYTYNARVIIGQTDSRQRHPLNAVYETGEEQFLGTCDSRGIGGVGVLVNRGMAKNINSFEQLTTRFGRLRMRKFGPTPALTIFVACAPSSSYQEEEVEVFYMDLEKFYREDHAFYKVIIGDFNAKVGLRRTPEEFHIGTHGLQWDDQASMGTRNSRSPLLYAGRGSRPTVLLCQSSIRDRTIASSEGDFPSQERADKFRERNPRTIINWDLLATIAGFWEDSAMDNMDEEYDRLVEHLREEG